MEGDAERQYTMTKVVRWTARLWSIASIGLILLFIFGEGMKRARPSEWLLFLFFPAGISIGMILAWWKEGLGGGITVGSLLLFYMIHFAVARTLPHGWAFLVFSFPGFLFLLCCYPAIKGRKSAT
jgi:hypothetical membrane protein